VPVIRHSGASLLANIEHTTLYVSSYLETDAMDSMYDIKHTVSLASDKSFSASSIVYAQNQTGLQVQNLRNPVILNIFFKSWRSSHLWQLRLY
jgi:hypothetical protein